MIKNDNNIYEAKNVIISGNQISLYTGKGDGGSYKGILSFTNLLKKPN